MTSWPSHGMQHLAFEIEEPSRLRQGTRWALLSVVAGCLLLIPWNSGRPLTHHEALLAQSAREMLANGDWILPTYYGQPRLQKPPLGYWLAMISYSATGGVSEKAARLPSSLAGLAFVLLVGAEAARYFGSPVGWKVSFLVATSVFLLTQARLAEVDAVLILAVAIAVGAFLRLFDADETYRSALTFWLSIGAAALAKGPVGIGMIASVVIATSLATKKSRPMRRLWNCRIGWLCFLLMMGAWPTAVVVRYPNAAALWWSESVGRVLETPHGVDRPFWYYAVAALWLTLPWTPCWLLWTFSRAFRQGLRDRRPIDAALAAWFFLPLVLLSFSAGKQEHYLMPSLAPTAIWAALQLDRWEEKCSCLGRRWLCGAGAMLMVSIFMIQSFLLPAFHGRRAEADWFTEASSTLNREEKILAVGHTVQWLIFYSDRSLVRFDSLEDLQRGASGTAWVLTSRGVLASLSEQGDVLDVVEPDVAGAKAPVLAHVQFRR